MLIRLYEMTRKIVYNQRNLSTDFDTLHYFVNQLLFRSERQNITKL